MLQLQAYLTNLQKKFGYSCYEVPVGFKYISSKLIEKNAVVGGESSGGLALLNHIYGKDSLVSIALILKIISKLNKPFDEIVKEMLCFADGFSKIMRDRQYSYTKEKEAEIKNILFTSKLLPNLKHKVQKIIYEDYVKLFYENDNWALIRFSGTEPILRIFVEFDNQQDCLNEIELWEKYLKIVQ